MFRIKSIRLLSVFLLIVSTLAVSAQEESDNYEDPNFVASDQLVTGSISLGPRIAIGSLKPYINPFAELEARLGTTLNKGFEAGLGVGLGFKVSGDSSFLWRDYDTDSIYNVRVRSFSAFRAYISKEVWANDDFRIMSTLATGFELFPLDVPSEVLWSQDLNVVSINPEISFQKWIGDHTLGAIVASYQWASFSYQSLLETPVGNHTWRIALSFEFR